LSSSQRAPSTEELFSNVDATGYEELVIHAATGFIEIGDSSLDEEASLNIDLNFSWQGKNGWAQLSLFHNAFEDYIFILNTGQEVDETAIYAYSQNDAKFTGVEFEGEFNLAELSGGELSIGVFGDYVKGEFDDAGDVPRMPPRRIGSELSWSNGNLGTFVRVVSAADQGNPGDFESDTSAYTRWDAGIDYLWQLDGDKELYTFLKWKNIGDEEIRLSTSFLRNFASQAGESVEAGVRLTF